MSNERESEMVSLSVRLRTWLKECKQCQSHKNGKLSIYLTFKILLIHIGIIISNQATGVSKTK